MLQRGSEYLILNSYVLFILKFYKQPICISTLPTRNKRTLFIISDVLKCILSLYTCIYTELAPKLTATASAAQTVERWSRVVGSIPSRRPWSCIFRNWSRFGSYNVYPSDTRIYLNLKKYLSVIISYASCSLTVSHPQCSMQPIIQWLQWRLWT